MGNQMSDIKDGTSKKLKSFKDIKFDILNLNEILSNSDFVREFACRLNMKIKGSHDNFSSIKYRLSKEVEFELEFKKREKTEYIDLTLPEFYQFYEYVLSYSISAMKSQDQNNPGYNPAPYEESKQDNTKGIDFSVSVGTLPLQDEHNICVICFEKGIQTIMPCSHGFCENCCSLWYEKKNKKDCPMCRKSLDGTWQEKSFEVVNQGNRNNAIRATIPKFINAKSLFLKIQ